MQDPRTPFFFVCAVVMAEQARGLTALRTVLTTGPTNEKRRPMTGPPPFRAAASAPQPKAPSIVASGVEEGVNAALARSAPPASSVGSAPMTVARASCAPPHPKGPMNLKADEGTRRRAARAPASAPQPKAPSSVASCSLGDKGGLEEGIKADLARSDPTSRDRHRALPAAPRPSAL